MDIETSLHPWTKSHLIVYDPFNNSVEFDLLIFFFKEFLHLWSLGIVVYSSLVLFLPGFVIR